MQSRRFSWPESKKTGPRRWPLVQGTQGNDPPNPEEYNRLFDAAIGSSALETDDSLGLKAQQEQQRKDLVKSMSKKSIMALKEMEGATSAKVLIRLEE